MKYDFETTNPRFGLGSAKWNQIEDTLHERPKDVIPFSIADMEFKTCPEIVAGLKKTLDNEVIGYADATDKYKKAVCDWMKKRHNWDAKPEWIVNIDGVVHAFHVCVTAYTKPGDGVLLMTLYYPMYHAITYNHRKLVTSPLIDAGDHFEIDWDDFEKKCADNNTKLFIFCSPHNPGTRLWTKEEQEKIYKICSENDVQICVDEIHNDLVMPGYHHVMLPTISKEIENNVVVMTAPSKSFNLAGFQTSNIFIPNKVLRDRFVHEMQYGTHTNGRCNYLGYKACYYAYTQGAEWLDQCIKVIDHNRQVVTDFLHENFPQIKIYRMEATYLLWMNWKGLGLNYKELERINHHEAKLFFDEGYAFGPAGEGFERWNLAVPTKYVESALNRMKKAYSKYVK